MYVSLLTILIASSVVFYFHKRISEQFSVHDSYLNSLRPIKYEINCSDSFFAFCSRNAGHPCRVLFIVCANHRGDIESDEYDRTLPFISTRTPAGFIWNISIDLKYQGNNYSINIFFPFSIRFQISIDCSTWRKSVKIICKNNIYNKLWQLTLDWRHWITNDSSNLCYSIYVRL